MNPFKVLGLPDNVSIADAKAAWRLLRTKLHPDHGGNEVKFKEAKDAWELIETGYRQEPPPKAAPPTPASSFGSSPRGPWPTYTKPKPYSRPTGPRLPATSEVKRNGKFHTLLNIQVTRKQAQAGCMVPFMHDGNVYNYEVRPGTSAHHREVSIPGSPIIGQNWAHNINIHVQLDIT